MSKAQARTYLRALGEEAHPRWTSLEIKFRIGELTETGLDRQEGIGALLRKLPSTQERVAFAAMPEMKVGFGRYADRMYKEVPQPYLDWAMEVVREAPAECSRKLERLAAWAMKQRELREERSLQLTASGGDDDEPMGDKPTCEICSAVAKTVHPCFYCCRQACLPCLKPAPGMLPVCTMCSDEWEAPQRPTSPRSAGWAQKVEYALEQMTAGIQQLQTRMIDVEKKQENVPKDPVTPPELLQVVYSLPADQLSAEGREYP